MPSITDTHQSNNMYNAHQWWSMQVTCQCISHTIMIAIQSVNRMIITNSQCTIKQQYNDNVKHINQENAKWKHNSHSEASMWSETLIQRSTQLWLSYQPIMFESCLHLVNNHPTWSQCKQIKQSNKHFDYTIIIIHVNEHDNWHTRT